MKQTLTEQSSARLVRIAPMTESLKMEVNKAGGMIVRNVPSTILDTKNANGRIYSVSAMNSALQENVKKNQYESRALLCTADDHPEGTYPKPSHSSHVVLSAKVVESNGQHILLNDWLILDTDQGKNLRALIEAGCSIGTSIRGLGRQNESTGHIEDYEYLGTDVVGQPSAGTYAEFKGLSEGIVVEAVSHQLVESVMESIKVSEQSEVKNMFNLGEAIQKFKNEHSESVLSKKAVADLLAIEGKVVESKNDVMVQWFDDFKSSVLGESTKVEFSQDTNIVVKSESAKNEDVLNKSDRYIEAAEVVANSLKEQNDTLQKEIDALRKYKENSNEVISKLTSNMRDLAKKIREQKEMNESHEEAIAAQMEAAAVKLGEGMQAEAKKVILSLESKLQASINVGQQVSDYFKASKAINESLIKRLQAEEAKKDVTESVTTRAYRVNKLSESLKESRIDK